MSSSTLSGINSIELVPDFNSPSIVKKLQRTIAQSKLLRSAIAYWTLPFDKMSEDLPQKLSGDGFLCVDINYPTNIDELKRIATRGGNVYLLLLKPNPQPGDLRTNMPPHLMHTKTFLFNLDDKSAEFWVGSHNWTARALSGLNIEASNVINMATSSHLYQLARELLNSIRSSCVAFDPANVDYYKWLQGQNLEDVDWIVDLEAKDAESLSGQRITLFMTSDNDFRNLKKVDKTIIVSVQDQISAKIYIYNAKVRDTGYVKASGLDYNVRLHVFHIGTSKLVVDGPSIPSPTKVKKSKYWATIEMSIEIPTEHFNFYISDFFGLPPQDRWLTTKIDHFEDRVAKEDRFLFEKSYRPLIQRPVTVDAFLGKAANQTELEYLQKIQPVEKPLIRKGIIPKNKAKDETG